jgi:hypothetical protein
MNYLDNIIRGGSLYGGSTVALIDNDNLENINEEKTPEPEPIDNSRGTPNNNYGLPNEDPPNEDPPNEDPPPESKEDVEEKLTEELDSAKPVINPSSNQLKDLQNQINVLRNTRGTHSTTTHIVKEWEPYNMQRYALSLFPYRYNWLVDDYAGRVRWLLRDYYYLSEQEMKSAIKGVLSHLIKTESSNPKKRPKKKTVKKKTPSLANERKKLANERKKIAVARKVLAADYKKIMQMKKELEKMQKKIKR